MEAPLPKRYLVALAIRSNVKANIWSNVDGDFPRRRQTQHTTTPAQPGPNKEVLG